MFSGNASVILRPEGHREKRATVLEVRFLASVWGETRDVLHIRAVGFCKPC